MSEDTLVPNQLLPGIAWNETLISWVEQQNKLYNDVEKYVVDSPRHKVATLTMDAVGRCAVTKNKVCPEQSSKKRNTLAQSQKGKNRDQEWSRVLFGVFGPVGNPTKPFYKWLLHLNE